MARRDHLRRIRSGTVINGTSKQQETDLYKALVLVEQRLKQTFANKITLSHEKLWLLRDIVAELRSSYPDSEFYYHFDTSSMRPYGGILFLTGQPDDTLRYPILVSEVKNQGTNDLRVQESLPRQAKGNAIERLGKNVVGFRAALSRESIFPFVCFGHGIDFANDSSILDRVSTVAMFGKLNTTYLHNDVNGQFARGSFYFRQAVWSVTEMTEIMTDIAERSILYYWSKYGPAHFS